MPYTMTPEGVDELQRMLALLGNAAGSAASKGLYEGAGIMADEIEHQADGIDTDPFHYAVFVTRKPSPEEKAALDGKVGIARFRREGENVTTSVGYGKSGYAMIAGRNKPVPLIANSINSGTSFMQKQPFVEKAVANGKGKATSAITKTIEEDLEKLIKG